MTDNQAINWINYLRSSITTLRGRMPQVSDAQIQALKSAMEEVQTGSQKAKTKPFDGFKLEELFALVVRCLDCGMTIEQALQARMNDTAHERLSP